MTTNHDDNGTDESPFAFENEPAPAEHVRDVAFELLSNRYCRHLLDVLRTTQSGAVTVDELAPRIAELKATAAAEDENKHRRRVRLSLNHVLLPKLDAAGLVDFDRRSETIRNWDNPELESILAEIQNDSGEDELPSTTAQADHDVGVDAWFELLRNRRRRYVLSVLVEHEELTLADLADEVAVREFDRPIRAISADSVLDIYLSLYHAHLPRFVEYGVVAYDQKRDLVTLAVNTGRLDRYLRAGGNE